MIEWIVGGGVLLALLASSRRPTGGDGVVERGRVTSGYLVRRSPTHLHRGIDIAAPKGTPVRSLSPGRVVQVTRDCQRSGYGNTVLVEHDDGTFGFHAHLDRFATSTGARVRRGQTIGYVGQTQCRVDSAGARDATPTMAPHLHLEVHTSSSRTPSGHYIVAENVPSRMDPEAYLARVGMAIADRPKTVVVS